MTRRFDILSLATAAITLGTPVASLGQESTALDPGEHSDLSVALSLETRAHEMAEHRNGWDRAARLYSEAARLRGSDDFGAAEDMWLAGYLYFYVGRTAESIKSLRAAGESFLALGDVHRAATTFFDGAWVAGGARWTGEAHELRERGRLLTRSPLLDTGDRVALLQRLDDRSEVR